MSVSFRIREAVAGDVLGASEVIRTAYLEGDAFYKKEECRCRVDLAGEAVRAMLAPEHQGVLLVAVGGGAQGGVGEGEGGDGEGDVVMGAVHCEWPSAAEGGTIPGWAGGGRRRVWSFGMLAVPARSGGRGAGRALVSAALARLRQQKAAVAAAGGVDGSAEVEIDVMVTLGNRPRNLLGWYAGQGFSKRGAEAHCWWQMFGVVHPDWEGKVMVQRMGQPL